MPTLTVSMFPHHLPNPPQRALDLGLGPPIPKPAGLAKQHPGNRPVFLVADKTGHRIVIKSGAPMAVGPVAPQCRRVSMVFDVYCLSGQC